MLSFYITMSVLAIATTTTKQYTKIVKLNEIKNKTIFSEWQQVPITITIQFIGMSEMEIVYAWSRKGVNNEWGRREIRILKQQAAAVAVVAAVQGDENAIYKYKSERG